MFVLPRDVAHAGTPVDVDRAVRRFHRGMPGYEPTPLHHLPALAREIGVGQVLVKDESQRFGLPAFKILGASWAIARLVAEQHALMGDLDLDRIRAALAGAAVTLTTATDGNHGRAVARMARMVGAAADVFVPGQLDATTVALIESEGARVVQVPGDYDAAVRVAAEHAVDGGCLLVQDTAWAGYEQVPGWIVDGYSTLLVEIDETAQPDLIVVPAGVGSLAQSVVSHYRGRAHIATVEPDSADCVRQSLLAGQPVTVQTSLTSMAGLNCGTPSTLAWPILRDGLSAAVAVSEAATARAVADLAALGVASGPCGAASLAGLRVLPIEDLGLGATSTIVLLSTEGSAHD